MPPECKYLRAASPRLVLLYDLTLSYYPLPLCLRFGSLTQFPSTLDLYDLAAACQGGIAALAAVMSAVIFQQIADGAVQHAADAGQNVKVKFSTSPRYHLSTTSKRTPIFLASVLRLMPSLSMRSFNLSRTFPYSSIVMIPLSAIFFTSTVYYGDSNVLTIRLFIVTIYIVFQRRI